MKRMKNIPNIVYIIFICIIVSFGSTFFVVSALKDQERLEKMLEYEHEISGLNRQLLNYSNQIITLNAQIDFLENRMYILEEFIDSRDVAPKLDMIKDTVNKKLTVASAGPLTIRWDEFKIEGTCNKANLGIYVLVGDSLTECIGEILIIHIPTNTLIGTYIFS
jgi:hypothetical protein